MNDWHEVPTVNNWEAWTIHVQLAAMPDGSVAPIGLRIDPRAGYDSVAGEQRLTLERLRQFPIGYATAHAKYVAQDASDEWERIRLLVDALAARMDYYDEYRAARTATAEADLQEMLMPLYSKLVDMLGENEARLLRAADVYREALRDTEADSPRAQDAEALKISLTTMDRLLREARSEGGLVSVGASQGKRGKSSKSRANRRGGKKRTGK